MTDKNYGYSHDKGLKAHLAHARGLGSANTGAHHWWLERLSSLLLIPLSLWFFTAISHLAGAPRQELLEWLAIPLNNGLLIVTVLAFFWHASMGMQVIYEDYISNKGCRVFVILVTRALCYGAAMAVSFILLLHLL